MIRQYRLLPWRVDFYHPAFTDEEAEAGKFHQSSRVWIKPQMSHSPKAKVWLFSILQNIQNIAIFQTGARR